MRRVVFNQKGGVGKTTIVCNLAAIAASRGLRTLVLDLDSQCNATQYLLGDLAGSSEGTIGDFFEGTLSFSLQSRGLEPSLVASQLNGIQLCAPFCQIVLRHRKRNNYKNMIHRRLFLCH